MPEFPNSATIAAARRRGGRLRNQGGRGRPCPPAPPRDLSRACAGLLAVAQVSRPYGPRTLESVYLDLALCGLMISLFISTIWIIATNPSEAKPDPKPERGGENV